MGPEPAFRAKLAESWPATDWQHVTVLAAVSGGADSVALLRGLAEMKTAGDGRLAVAHFNHHLRGSESDADEAFVRRLCAALKLPLEVGQSESQPLASAGDGLEAAARDARYQFLAETADRLGARFVATAHTADDQVETILQRIIRGTGLAGLAGIPRTRDLTPAATLIRPLLAIRRTEVLDYLQFLKQDFRDDLSNLDPKFTRNRIRHELLPLLARDYNAGVHDALLRLGALAGEAQEAIDEQVQELAVRCVRFASPQEARVQCASLEGIRDYLVREMFVAIFVQQGWPRQEMDRYRWHELAVLARSATGQLSLPGRIRAEKQGEWLVLTRPVESLLVSGAPRIS